MKVSKGHVTNLIEFLVNRQVDIHKMLIESGLSQVDFTNTLEGIEQTKFLDFLEQAIKACKDDKFGLNYGCYLNLKSLGLILEISLNTSKIEPAILYLQEYMQATFPMVNIAIDKKETDFRLTLTCQVKEKKLHKHLLDSVYCVIYRELKLMLDANHSPILFLPYDDRSAYELAMGVDQIRLGDGYSFCLEKEVLSMEINKGKLRQIEYLLPKFIQEIHEMEQAQENLSKKARMVILNLCTPELPKIDQVVNQFPMSKRSFQRQLLKEHTSYRELTNIIKQRIAFYLEQESIFTTTDISVILGYSEPSAYLHAKAKWQISR